jgi:MoxR-like ATPase
LTRAVVAEGQFRELASLIDEVRSEVGRVIVGQEYLINRLLIALLCNGHILIEGMPGLAKTLSVRTLADALDMRFVRLQFTPDLLPADLIGTRIYNQHTGEFSVELGPIFSNIVLADEINRAPAKVQSALLEAMQERQVTIAGVTRPLVQPFMVLATQNPIEQEGTYPLPEAQLDRFLLKALVGYPNRLEEREILDRGLRGDDTPIRRVASGDAVLAARAAVRAVHIDDRLKDYMVQLVRASREPAAFGMQPLAGLIAFGASPRATIFLGQTAQAHAFLDGRHYVTPEDVKAVAPDVFRHRVVITYEAEAEDLSVDAIVERLLGGVAIP